MPDDLATTETGLALVYGSEDEGRSWIGRSFGKRFCEDEVTWPAIKHFCALVGDGNRLYWDEDFARDRFGAVPAPPGMLFVWSMPPLWRPEGVGYPPTVSTQVPLPGNTVINVGTDSEFAAPILVGERLTIEESVSDVSGAKSTALGRGHFITTEAVFRNRREEVVAKHRNVLFRYTVEKTEAPAAKPREAAREEEAAGELLPEVTMPVTLRLCVHDAAATRDYFPGHHDRDYARAQNARDTYLNTMFFHGLVDRVVTDWTGPEGRVIARRLRMLTPICIGDEIRTRARVIERKGDVVDVQVEVRAQHGVGATAVVSCKIAEAGS